MIIMSISKQVLKLPDVMIALLMVHLRRFYGVCCIQEYPG